MNLTQRLEIFGAFYRFDRNSYPFEKDVKRIILRNDALRTGKIDPYREYLSECYPELEKKEMERFHLSFINLMQISGVAARKLFEDYQVNNTVCDIIWTDPECIHLPQKLSDDDLCRALQTDEEYVLQNVDPFIISEKKELWVDMSDL